MKAPKGQPVIGSSATIRHPPCELADPEVPLSPAAPESPPPSGRTAGGSTTVPPPEGPALPKHSWFERSEFGATQAVVHAASTVPWPAPGGSSTPLDPPHVTGHWQVHVDGQSESIAHAGVCCATHIFELMERQVLPASQIAGTWNGKPESGPGRNGGMGTSLQGTVMLVWYGARTTVAWFGPHW